MIKKAFILVLTMFSVGVYGQQESQYTQYMYNTMMFNPAYTGSREVGSFFGMFRTQWVGIKGAPTNGSISYHQPMESLRNVGLGGSIFRESIGPQNQTDLTIDFSYTLNFENSKLAFGINGSGSLFQINYDELNKQDQADPNLSGSESVFSPNIGAGIYWYTDKYYLGFSVPNMLETTHYNKSSVSVLKNTQHMYLIGGYVFNLSENTKFKPAVLSKIAFGAPLQLDLSANFMFNEKFVLGAAYRWSAAVSVMAGFQISERWFAGYAYDFETTELSKYNSGSHEIFLRYELLKTYKKIVSPRFF
ncbi:MAG: type IX secretion system membrane protein PorP/SprF [Capnocytophaga sp.]|uniref:Bacteroidetes-specific putative membrane protein n=1 Tax=Capnocytophaga ochracea F0287 TaxID=873517 RepID=E4MPI1_CAPOC|nr:MULTISPECIES: type IX secretion system membrane protein PorP/SprF [Capnocytophaga]EFS98401.1 Bacteroidetes-specific putative membrane protein [Capnocytophaga ochracea F0287]EJF43194.1 Bacteroidetes-specific putative membrane protein [Capnocytophaga ochracea str. Holt 25]MDU6659010.1 type IX secretion system membrane protein PorP/SprF [Capnocytophaga sp.]UEB43333.1 type IX secretion system membrane protein PorP/SprF [Capnocytophaga ochracea]